ncbi:MAG: hypothetical protein R3F19_15730 [Verrucomicrobiales bacterium]
MRKHPFIEGATALVVSGTQLNKQTRADIRASWRRESGQRTVVGIDEHMGAMELNGAPS